MDMGSLLGTILGTILGYKPTIDSVTRAAKSSRRIFSQEEDPTDKAQLCRHGSRTLPFLNFKGCRLEKLLRHYE